MDNFLLKNAHLYHHQCFEDVDILIQDGKIKEIGKNIESNG